MATMPPSPPIVIPLCPPHNLSKEDLTRALFCATAVYEKNNVVAGTCLYPSITNFEKVHMSLDSPGSSKFLIAYTEDAVYIAFKGTDSLKDTASNLQIDSHARFGGSFHRGFFKRAEAFNYFNHNPLRYLIGTKKRIIFCGHSLGGAVAHMVLLQFLLECGLPGPSRYPQDSLFSIAFGAPHVCDEIAARNINNHGDLKWRFINFVNQSDPVPRLLHDIKSSVAAILRGKLAQVQGDDTLKFIGGFAGRCLQGGTEDGTRGGAMAGALHLAGKASNGLTRHVTQWFSQMSGAASHHNSTSTDNYREPDFNPIGRYIFLKRQLHAGGYGCRTRWSALSDEGDNILLSNSLSSVEITEESWEQHKLDSYKNALIETSFIDRPPLYTSTACNSPSSIPGLVVTPVPKVIFAKWMLVDSGQQYINIHGENLLFLRESVTFNGQPCSIICQEDDNVVVTFDHSVREIDEKANSSGIALPWVFIPTAFGVTSKQISEDYCNTGAASRMISRIIQTLIVKATPPLKILPQRSTREALDNIMHCVPALKGKGVSQILDNITNSRNHGPHDLQDQIRSVNYMDKAVTEFMRSSFELESASPPRKLLARAGLLAMTVVAGVAGVATCPVSIGAGVFYLGMAVTGGFTSVTVLSPTRTIIDGYLSVLELAIQEASEWSMSEEGKVDVTSIEMNDVSYEAALIKQVKEGNDEFREMVDKAHTYKPLDENVPCLKSEGFQTATPKSRLRLLKRIKVVVDTISLYTKEVAGIHFIGIVGVEDAGKSTFIKKALETFRQSNEWLPETGFHTHTSVVRSYELSNSIWLVDFPGGNGLGPHADQWKHFTALPSSSLLLFTFEGDIKKEQVKMYTDMKEGFRTEIKVVFNKVDENVSERNRCKFTADYFKKQKKNSASVLKCSEDDVYYACLNPDPPKILDELKAVGVLGFEELANELKIAPR